MKSVVLRVLSRVVGLAGVKRNRQKLLRHRTISLNPLGKIILKSNRAACRKYSVKY